MGGLKRTAAFSTALALMMALVSCEYSGIEKESSAGYAPGIVNNVSAKADEKRGEIIGNYQYPENPAEQLRRALENDINKRGLSMEIGKIERVEFDGKECSQFKINFENGNICVISFTNRHIDYGYEESLDGRDNPSFTMAFRNPDNSQDMITALSSVIKYLSPDLSFEEAEHLATEQDNTIGTDGYSQPSDIAGYQIQARYTNPHTFISTPDFEAKYGVNVRAIKQLWRGTIDMGTCQELKTSEDYNLLTKEYPYWEENAKPKILYADFVIKNVWQRQSYIHGETWVTVDVESMTGKQFSLVLDTWEYPSAYEFGVGQQYTLFIRWDYHVGLIYAVQQSETAQFNSRGEVQPIDYPTDDFRNPIRRIEPEGEGTIYDVRFVLESQTYAEQFAALYGQGIGEKQWPDDPTWEGYTFVGWYDNLEWSGSPYTKDTPIYQNTSLRAKWKYSGSGGVWPRARRGDIQGIDEGSRLSVGEKLTITASGYNMNLEAPTDQRFRWYPVSWKLSDGTSGRFSNEAPFQTVLSLDNKGERLLYITYLEETFDGVDWQETGQLREVPEVAFRVE